MIGAYDAMMRAQQPQTGSPFAKQVGNREGAEAYRKRAVEYNNKMRELHGMYKDHPEPPEEAVHAMRLYRHERDNAINQWQELTSRGARSAASALEFNEGGGSVGPVDATLSGTEPPPGAGATSIDEALRRRAAGVKPNAPR